MNHGAARGLGVSSRMLVRMLYQEAGWYPKELSWDRGLNPVRGWESVVEWLRNCRWFGPAERIEPGDLLVRIGAGAQFAVAISDPSRLSDSRYVVQCLQPSGVMTTKLAEAEWLFGFKLVLRPLAIPRS